MKSTTKLRLALDHFKTIDEAIPLSAIEVFLRIVEKPGVSIKEIERLTGMSTSTAARLVQYLSVVHWRKGPDGNPLPGLDLVVVVQSPHDSRAKIAAPTVKGRRLAESINALISGEQDGST